MSARSTTLATYAAVLKENCVGANDVEVMHRFPTEDYEDSPFPESLAPFCFPTYEPEVMLSQSQTFHQFVMTEGDGVRVYGSCFVTWESAQQAVGSGMPNVISGQHESLGQGDAGNDESIVSAADKQLSEESQELQLSNTTAGGRVALVLLSHWPMWEAFHHALLCFVDCCKMITTQAAFSQTRLLEELLFFLLESVPLPPSGMETRIQIRPIIGADNPEPNNAEATHAIVCVYRPDLEELPGLCCPLQVLFSRLDPNNVLTVFSAILQEAKIVFVSSHPSVLTPLAEALLSLIFPLVWAQVYVPLLPPSMIEFIHAPMPFIVGVSRPDLRGNAVELPDDVMVVDVDTNTVTSKLSLPEFPDRLADQVINDLNKCANIFGVSCSARESSTNSLEQDFGSPQLQQPQYTVEDSLLPYPTKPSLVSQQGIPASDPSVLDLYPDKLETEQSEPTKSLAVQGVRDAFLSVLIALFERYREFTDVGDGGDAESFLPFRLRPWLDSLPMQCWPIAQSIAQTQMFSEFIWTRTAADPSRSEAGAVALFDRCIANSVTGQPFSLGHGCTKCPKPTVPGCILRLEELLKGKVANSVEDGDNAEHIPESASRDRSILHVLCGLSTDAYKEVASSNGNLEDQEADSHPSTSVAGNVKPEEDTDDLSDMGLTARNRSESASSRSSAGGGRVRRSKRRVSIVDASQTALETQHTAMRSLLLAEVSRCVKQLLTQSVPSCPTDAMGRRYSAQSEAEDLFAIQPWRRVIPLALALCRAWEHGKDASRGAEYSRRGSEKNFLSSRPSSMHSSPSNTPRSTSTSFKDKLGSLWKRKGSDSSGDHLDANPAQTSPAVESFAHPTPASPGPPAASGIAHSTGTPAGKERSIWKRLGLKGGGDGGGLGSGMKSLLNRRSKEEEAVQGVSPEAGEAMWAWVLEAAGGADDMLKDEVSQIKKQYHSSFRRCCEFILVLGRRRALAHCLGDMLDSGPGLVALKNYHSWALLRCVDGRTTLTGILLALEGVTL